MKTKKKGVTSGKVKMRGEHEDFLQEFKKMAEEVRECSVEDLRENIAGILMVLMQGFFKMFEANQKNFEDLQEITLKYIGGEFNKRQGVWEQHIEAAERQVQENSAALLACMLRTYVIEQCLLSKGIAKDKKDCRNVDLIPKDELSTILDLFGWGIDDLNNMAKHARQFM